MKILSHDLNEYITIEEQQQQSLDNTGGYKKQWHAKYQLWARIESLFNRRQIGHEIAVAKQIQSTNYYEFSIRYQENLNNKMRIIWKKRTFNIIKIIEVNNKTRFLSLIAEELN